MARVSVTNITVNVNNFAAAYKAAGLGPIPPGTTVDAAVNTLETSLLKQLTKDWPSQFTPIVSYQEDRAIMAPWKDNVPGTAPACVTQAITQDFTSWSLPVDKETITNMAKQITQEISNNGGQRGTFYGKSRIAGSSTIFWGVAFTTAVVVDNPEETGILYMFTAALG